MGDFQFVGDRDRCKAADDRVFSRIVMLEPQGQMIGYHVQLVAGKKRPDLLRHLDGAKIGQFRIGLPVRIEGPAHYGHIKRCIVRQQKSAAKIVHELVHDFGKFRRVFDVFRVNPMNSDVHRSKTHVFGAYQPLFDARDDAVFNPRQTHRAGATALFIGCFKVDSNRFHDGSRANGSVACTSQA